MTRRRAGLGAAAAAVAVLLSGCGGLSGAGPVEPGLEVGSGEQAALGIVFPGPVDGDSREDIVNGFLRAGAASNGAYDNARKFLTVQAAERWNPDSTIVLRADDATPTTTLTDPAHVTVTAAAAGTVGPDSRFTPAPPGAKVSATFDLTSISGQWRISGMPEGFGRWIAQRDVSRLVQPFDVNYISTSRQATVPDVRWFPLDKLATRLARAQLTPVPDHLIGAATTAVPQGSRLLGDAVSLDSGTATVNLVAGRAGPGEQTRQNMWAQFVSTLSQDPSVSRVELAINGTPVDLVGLTGPATSLADIGFPPPVEPTSAHPVVRRGAEVTVFNPTDAAPQTVQPTPGADRYPPVTPEFTRLALSPDGAELAGVDPDGAGISRWRGTTRYEVPGFGSAVGNPSYDSRGYLWVGGIGNAANRLFVIDVGADPADARAAAATPVRADWLAGRRVLESRVALDGDRVAVLSTGRNGGDVRIDLAGVVRGGGGRPERLSPPLRLGVTVTDAVGLTWVDDTDVATIAAVGGGTRRPTVLSVGGDVRPLEPVEGAVAITTTAGERNLYVVTSTGRLLGLNGTQWADSGRATDLAVPAG
ncbi:MAG TPA: GerMN domain-containing protein [Phycicoccus sp.]|nr:GerMN domain-containing protein [Phycicoccus sp.]